MTLKSTPLRTAYLAAQEDLLRARGGAGADAASAAFEAARLALHESDEPEQWSALEIESGVTIDLGVEPVARARSAAEAFAREGSFDLDAGTAWVDVRIVSETGHEETITVTIDPEEPECAGGHEHEWQSPIGIVGGIAENPGVWGHAGGVTIHEVCPHCGAHRHTDTWAQRPDTGEQGLTSISYGVTEYEDE